MIGQHRLAYNDKVHGYWYNTKRTRSITEVAKMAEDTGRLEKWHDRKIAVGFAMKPQLLEKVRVKLDDPAAINAVCEMAVAEAGAHEGRDRGTIIHEAVEQFDLGKKLIVSDLTSPVIENWQWVLDKMAWSVVHVEQVVVWPEQNIAGRFDRIVRGDPCHECKRDLYVVDFKTGAQILRYPKSIANQLYMYAAAPLLCEPFELLEGKGFTERIGEMPDVCLCVGYVAHYPPDAAPNIIAINLELGRYGTEEILFKINAWRKKPVEEFAEVILEGNDDPARLLPPDDDEDLFEDDYNRIAEATDDQHPVRDDGDRDHSADAQPDEVSDDAGVRDVGMGATGDSGIDQRVDTGVGADDTLGRDARRDNIRTRLVYLKSSHPHIAREVINRWPVGVGKISSPLTDEDLDAIEAVLIQGERVVEAPFNPLVSQPRHDPVSGDAPTPPAPEPIREGKEMGEWKLNQLADAIELLDEADVTRINDWAQEANDAGHPISIAAVPSIRRFHIAQTMLLALHHPDETLRNAIAMGTGTSSIHVSIGALLGALTQPQVVRVWDALLELDGNAEAQS